MSQTHQVQHDPSCLSCLLLSHLVSHDTHQVCECKSERIPCSRMVEARSSGVRGMEVNDTTCVVTRLMRHAQTLQERPQQRVQQLLHEPFQSATRLQSKQSDEMAPSTSMSITRCAPRAHSITFASLQIFFSIQNLRDAESRIQAGLA